nr:response regulator [Nitrospirales bacterium]
MINDSPAILVVDDEPEMQQLLRDILEEEHYRVMVASDGHDALNRMETEKFPVVLTDLRMKGMDGLALLDHVLRKHPDSNLIMMTAFGTVES